MLRSETVTGRVRPEIDDDCAALLFVVDREYRIVAINEAMLEWLGLRRDEALGRPLARVLGDGDLAVVGVRAREALESGRNMSCRETLAARLDTEPRCFEFSYLPLASSGESALACTAREVGSDRSFEAELLEAASRERRRLGRDLHDTLGQDLAHTSMLLQGLERRLAGEAPQLLPYCREVRDAVTTAAESMRATVHGLLPADLEGGLPAALAGLASRFTRYDGIGISFVGPQGPVSLPPGTAEQVYRFAQEALSNILRHASARTVTVALAPEQLNLVLTIEDDGVGLGPAAARNAGGMGLRFMRSRAGILGGSVEFVSPGRGTRVVLTVPYDNGPDAQAARATDDEREKL